MTRVSRDAHRARMAARRWRQYRDAEELYQRHEGRKRRARSLFARLNPLKRKST